jgi:hypothetical protein
MDDRQLKVSAYIQGKAIETLKSMPLDSAMDAVRAYKLAAEMERMIRGKPSEQSVADLEKKIWAEHERFLVPVELEPESEEEPEGTEPQAEPQAESRSPAEAEPTFQLQTPVVEEPAPEEDDE